jgi:pimeloyl-ACP methyl ester carboxylesterase
LDVPRPFLRRIGLQLSVALLAFGLFVHERPARAQPTASDAPAKPPVAELPEGVVPGETVVMPVPNDKPALVIHAAAENRRAIVYLPGLCGNVRAVEAWKEAAVRSGTLVGLLGDRPCGGGRYKWGKKLDVIQARIERALVAVKAARGGALDIEHPLLFGYSQGADRAEHLAELYPQKYRRVVLGGSPHEPTLRHLGDTQVIAVFGGELETFGHMQAGAEVLAAAGKPAHFFLFPRAKHGDFGPEGNRVMGELFTWLLAEDEPFVSAQRE